MVRFKSAVTSKGNSSYSLISQEEADARAAALDENDCVGCTNCVDLRG